MNLLENDSPHFKRTVLEKKMLVTIEVHFFEQSAANITRIPNDLTHEVITLFLPSPVFLITRISCAIIDF